MNEKKEIIKDSNKSDYSSKDNNRTNARKGFPKRNSRKQIRKDKGDGYKGKFKKEELNNSYGGNDLSWWTKDPELMNNAANVKANYIPGMPIDPSYYNFIVPGAYRFNFIPSFGKSWTTTDPLNVTFRDLYLRMFQKYRGITSYAASDLGIAIMAGMGVFMTIFRLERIYGIINRYSKANLNLPTTEIAALGLSVADADYIRSHLSDFRYDLNLLIRKAQRLCIPGDFTCIADWMALLAFEYLDHDSTKGTLVIFDAPVALVYDDISMQSGGCIVYEACNMVSTYPLIDTSSAFPNMFPMLTRQLDQLLGSTSIQRIYADLLVWFGEQQLMKINPLVEEFILAPVYDQHISHRVHNGETSSHYAGAGQYLKHYYYNVVDTSLTSADVTFIKNNADPNGVGLVIYQLLDNIKCFFGFVQGTATSTWVNRTNQYGSLIVLTQTGSGSNAVYGEYATILDSYGTDLTEENVIEGHLFKSVKVKDPFASSGSTVYTHYVTACSFELLTDFAVCKLNVNGTVTNTAIDQVSSTPSAGAGELVFLDWAPLTIGITGANAVNAVYGDLETMRLMYPAEKTRILDAIIYSGIKTEVKVLA